MIIILILINIIINNHGCKTDIIAIDLVIYYNNMVIYYFILIYSIINKVLLLPNYIFTLHYCLFNLSMN